MKNLWIETTEQGVYIFKPIGTFDEDHHFGRLLYIISGVYYVIGHKYPFEKKYSKKLEPWEIVKFKLEGVINV